MIKLDTNSIPVTYPDDSHTDLESVRRLIVLVPADTNYAAVTHRVWELANALGCHILFLSLCGEEAQEASVRRQLITMSAMVADGRVGAEARVELGSNWVSAVRSNWHDGDMIVCFAEQRTGFLHRPLSQILRANLSTPIYILSGLSIQNEAGLHRFSQFLGWIGSIAIIFAAFVLQVRIMSLSENWAQTSLLLISMLGEVGLIWGWNALFS